MEKFNSNFWKVFFGFFWSFSLSRLMSQVDLIMITYFGEKAIAAFSVPNDLMVIDALAALLVTPTITLRVSECVKNGLDKDRVVLQMLIFGVVTSIILTIVGLLVYLPVYRFYNLEPAVKTLVFQFLKNRKIRFITSPKSPIKLSLSSP